MIPRPMVLAIHVLALTLASSVAYGNTVAALSWDHDSNGQTHVTIVCSDPIPASSFRSYHLADPPRAVIVMEHVTKATDPAELRIEDRHIESLRLVLHPDRSPPELLVVIDLTSPTAEIAEIRHDGDRITAVVGSATSSAPAIAALPTAHPATATPIPSQRIAETATPTPTPPSTSTTTPSPTATAAPTETFTQTPTPSAAPTFPDRPAPPVLPVVPGPTTDTPPPSPPSKPRVDATPTPDPDPAIASRVVDITASGRGDGSTLLRITADGRIPQGDARYLEVSGEPPRIVVTIRGLKAPDLPRSTDFDDVNIKRIRLIHDAETIDGELHLVLHLTGSQISVENMQQVGPHLVVQLAPVGGTSVSP